MPTSPWPIGIVPSLNTPFTAEGTVDFAAHDRLVREVAGAGCTGILLLAVAGEGETLTEDESRALLRHASSVTRSLPTPLPVVASLGGDPARAERRAAAYAADGANILLYQAPPGSTAEALRMTLARIAAAGAPIMLQDFDPAGPGIPIERLVGLTREIDALRYVKVETRPSGPKMTAVLQACRGAIHVSGGWAVNEMLDSLARGVHAFIPTELEPVYVAITRAYWRGDQEEAAAMFKRIAPVLAFANRDVGTSIRFLKRLRHRRGLFATERCRAPVPDFDAATLAEADRLIDLAIATIAHCRS